MQSFIIPFAVKRWFLKFATAARLPNPARCLSDSKLLVRTRASLLLIIKLISAKHGGFGKQNFLNLYSPPNINSILCKIQFYYVYTDRSLHLVAKLKTFRYCLMARHLQIVCAVQIQNNDSEILQQHTQIVDINSYTCY